MSSPPSPDWGATEGRPRWNHNLEYHRLVIGAIPAGARTALDVGTGDGYLARDLRQVVPEVTAIDADAAVLDRARSLDPGVHWVLGDALTHPLPEAGFDAVASIATLHHLPDATAALARMAALTAPVDRIGRRPAPVDQDFGQVLGESQSWVAVLGGEVVGVVVAHRESRCLLVETSRCVPARKATGSGPGCWTSRRMR